MIPDNGSPIGASNAQEGSAPRNHHVSLPQRPIGWGRFLLEFSTVAVTYFVVSAIPFGVYAIFDPAILSGGVESMPSSLMLASLVLSMAGGLLVAWLWLRRDAAVRTAFSLEPPREWSRALLGAAAAAIAVLLWFQIGSWALRSLGLPEVDASLLLGFVTESPLALIAWIVLVAWLAAGTGEELLWRGWLMDRLGRLPGLAGRDWAVIVIQGIIFGLAHGYQSVSGMIVTGVVGLLFGWMRLRVFASLWPLIIAHAAVDTISMTMAYVMPELIG